MPDESLVQLILRLITKTEKGEVPWEQLNQHAFFATLKTGEVQCGSTAGDFPFYLSILNAEGNEIESVHTSNPAYSSSWYAEDWEQALETLYDLARRRALQIDVVVRGLIDELGG